MFLITVLTLTALLAGVFTSIDNHAQICGGTRLAIRLNRLHGPLRNPCLMGYRHKQVREIWAWSPLVALNSHGAVWDHAFGSLAEVLSNPVESRFSDHSTYCSAFVQVSECWALMAPYLQLFKFSHLSFTSTFKTSSHTCPILHQRAVHCVADSIGRRDSNLDALLSEVAWQFQFQDHNSGEE